MASHIDGELAWLHDCTLARVRYDVRAEGDYDLAIEIQCPHDLGYEPWAGRRIILIARDVLMMRHHVWGVSGPDSLDSVDTGVSTATRAILEETARKGLRYEGAEYSITFHSGSSLELVCGAFTVAVQDDR